MPDTLPASDATAYPTRVASNATPLTSLTPLTSSASPASLTPPAPVTPSDAPETPTRAGAVSPSAQTGGLSVAAIGFDGVSIRMGSRTVLDNVSLSIAPGEFVGVLGPNGAGKTTLMRALLGLVPTTQGQISLFGQPIASGDPSIGYMPQVRAMTTGQRVSGRDFVACVVDGHRWGLPRLDAAARRAVDEALETVGATSLARRPVGDMSGGERQRLLLAQCLIGKPRVLLLDEPLISLDPHRQQSVVDLVADITRRLGITTLFSAHELNPLLGAIDKVLYLGNGAAALGTVDDVITGPILSTLYGAPIDVMRVNGRIFVMSGGQLMEKDAHHHHA